MKRRAEGYVRKEITISVMAERYGYDHIWRCKICGRWHGVEESGMDDDRGVCDECWAKNSGRLIPQCRTCRCGVVPWYEVGRILCHGCGAKTSHHDDDLAAVAEWNRMMQDGE